MAIKNRLRNESLAASLEQAEHEVADKRTRTSPTTFDTVYDFNDYGRMKSALSEMRSCCRTTKALASFEDFETKLRKKRENEMTRPRVSSLDENDEVLVEVKKPNTRYYQARNERMMKSEGAQAIFPLPATKGSTSSHTSQLPWDAAKALRPRLPKSQTTGNIVTLSIATSPRQKLDSSALANAQFCAQMMKERNERAARRAEQVRRRTDCGIVSESLPKSQEWTSLPKQYSFRRQVSTETSSGSQDQFSTPEYEPRGHTRTRQGRRSSGDKLKDILDGGISSIRRISRRVTGGGVGGGSVEGDVL